MLVVVLDYPLRIVFHLNPCKTTAITCIESELFNFTAFYYRSKLRHGISFCGTSLHCNVSILKGSSGLIIYALMQTQPLFDFNAFMILKICWGITHWNSLIRCWKHKFMTACWIKNALKRKLWMHFIRFI